MDINWKDHLVKKFSAEIESLEKRIDVIKTKGVRYSRSEDGGPMRDVTDEILKMNLVALENYHSLVDNLTKQK